MRTPRTRLNVEDREEAGRADRPDCLEPKLQMVETIREKDDDRNGRVAGSS